MQPVFYDASPQTAEDGPLPDESLEKLLLQLFGGDDLQLLERDLSSLQGDTDLPQWLQPGNSDVSPQQ